MFLVVPIFIFMQYTRMVGNGLENRGSEMARGFDSLVLRYVAVAQWYSSGLETRHPETVSGFKSLSLRFVRSLLTDV